MRELWEEAGRDLEEAVKLYRDDRRFRAMAQSCVAASMVDHGEINITHPERDAYEIALSSAVLMAARIYWQNSEIMALRAEVQSYKDALEKYISLSPPRLPEPPK